MNKVSCICEIKILIFVSFFCLISCNKKEIQKNEFYEKLAMQKKEILLEGIGKKYFEKNCLGCHANKGAKDNFLEYSIKNQKYRVDFFRDYITKQDSLLRNGNKDALAIKEWSNYNSYFHSFVFNKSEAEAIFYYLKK
ncbi:c-type cytochrome [Flavobacterium collinsii]